MGLFGTVGKFAKGLNWVRLGLYAIIVALIFGAGYQYSNTKHAEQDAIDAAATAQEIARLSREHAEEMRILALAAAEKTKIFTADIAEIEIHRDALIESIRAAQLTKPASEVRIEACVESDGESDVQIVVANPFDDAFRVLYNQAARNLRPTGSAGTDPD